MYTHEQALAATSKYFSGDTLATDVEKISEQQLEDTENLTVHLLSLQEVKELLQQGSIRQALMAAPLWKYMAERII
jgi:ADP-ribose pyrophosphatase